MIKKIPFFNKLAVQCINMVAMSAEEFVDTKDKIGLDLGLSKLNNFETKLNFEKKKKKYCNLLSIIFYLAYKENPRNL